MLTGGCTAMLAAACGASSHAALPGTGSGYPVSTMRLLRDDRALDRGVLTYSALTSLQVQQATTFDVQVTDVGRGPERRPFARESHGRLVAPQDVPAGGFVSVEAVCSGGLTCSPRSSSARQAIPGPGRSATWRWEVAARSPGNARILLIATSYGRRSTIVLRETSVMVRVAVRSTPLYLAKTYVDSHAWAIIFLVSGLMILAGVLWAVLVLLRRMGRAGERTTSPRAGLSEAATEVLRTTDDRPVPVAVPVARAMRGRKALLWLAPVDIAAGALALWAVRSGTSMSLGHAVIAAAAVVVALPLYFLPVIIAYLRPGPDRASVAIVGVFLGWTYVGWVVALALAVRDGRPAVVVVTERGYARPNDVTNRNPAVRDEPDVSRAGQGALL